MIVEDCEVVWVDRQEASRILGEGYSLSGIKRKIQRGELIKGIHFVQTRNRRYKLNVRQIQLDWAS